MEADELRLGACGRLGNGGVGEALSRRLGRALSICRIWGGCERCAGRERIRGDELWVLQLLEVRQSLLNLVNYHTL